MTFERVSRGQNFAYQLRADTWNAFIDAANFVKFNGGPNSPTRTAKGLDNVILAKGVNVSATDVLYGDVVKITDSGYDPDAVQEWVAGDVVLETRPVQAGDSFGGFGVALSNAAASQSIAFEMAIGGVVPVMLNVQANGEWIDRADIDENDPTHLLVTPEGAAKVIWRESGTGSKKGFVCIEKAKNIQHVGVTAGPIDPDGSGTVNLWNNGADTSYPITAHLDWMHNDEGVSSGKEVLVEWFPLEQKWRIIGAECEGGFPVWQDLGNVSGNITLDYSTTDYYRFIATGDTTLDIDGVPDPATPADTGRHRVGLEVIQDATGGHEVTAQDWEGVNNFQSVLQAVRTAANAHTFYEFFRSTDSLILTAGGVTGSFSDNWVYAGTGGTPGSGEWRRVGGTELRIHRLSDNGNDADNILWQLPIGSSIIFSELNDPKKGETWVTTGSPVDNGAWFSIPGNRTAWPDTISSGQITKVEYQFA